MSCTVNYKLTFQRRRLNSLTMEDAYKASGGNLFEICSSSVGDCVFKELFEDVNIVRKGKGMIVSLKEYHFKTVMERLMLNRAVKVVELRYRRDRNTSG